MRRYQTIAEAGLRDADVLLWRPGGFSAIAVGGGGRVSHASLVRLWDWEPFNCEFREWIGGRCVPLAPQVAARPGQIDLYRALRKTDLGTIEPRLDEATARRVARRMAAETSRQYNYAGVLTAALLHLAGLRLLPPVRRLLEWANEDLQNPRLPWFCSQGVAAVYELETGEDPVPDLRPGLTEPVHLARTSYFSYLATLVPDEAARQKCLERDRLAGLRQAAADEGPTVLQFRPMIHHGGTERFLATETRRHGA